MAIFRKAGFWVFVILFGTYAYFWQSRDWNSATRLMLTYAIVDRGTISLDGLEDQTGDRASFGGKSYTDKLPGFSLLATIPYSVAKFALKLPAHPRNVKAIPFWPADYWATLGTSGLLTALTGVLLAGIARDLSCGPRASALVGIAYGLGTPAFAYATMSHGHQSSAFVILASFALLWRTDGKRQPMRVGLAGFLASYASMIELQLGPVSAILGLYLLGQVFAGVRKPSQLANFAVGAIVPALILLGYNQLAFGSPWDMGYFHHSTKIFADVHSEKNPLGLTNPQAARVLALLWGRHRGLLFYAPVVALTPLGFIVLMVRKAWGPALVSTAVMLAVFLVNSSYPEWTGGWSTGPRLLVPLLPFAMIPVAGLLAAGGKWAAVPAVLLTFAGGVLMFLFVGVGGKLPQFLDDPLFQAVWPIWRGSAPIHGWVGESFARNAVSWTFPGFVAELSPGMKWVQFAPLVVGQIMAIGAMIVSLNPTSNLRVDQQEHGRGEQQHAEDPGAEPKRVPPDPGPGFVTRGGVDEADRDHEG